MTRRSTVLLFFLLSACVARARGNQADSVRIKGMLERAEDMIRRPGSLPVDLDSAWLLITQVENEVAQKALRPYWRLSALQLRGRIHLERQEWAPAKKVLFAAAEQFGTLGAYSAQAWCYMLYGSYLPFDDDLFEEKSAMFEQAAALYRRDNNREEAVSALKNAADMHNQQHKVDQAVAELLLLVEECRTYNMSQVADIYKLLSAIEKTRGNYYQALDYGLSMIRAREQFNITTYNEHFYVELARVYYMLENYEEGVRWHLKAQEAFLKNKQFIYYDLISLIQAMIRSRRSQEALQLIDKCVKTVAPNPVLDQEVVLVGRGMCYFAQGDIKKAEQCYDKTAGVTETYNVMVFKFTGMAELYIKLKAFEKAGKYAGKLLHVDPGYLTAADRCYGYYLAFKADSAMGHTASAIHYLSLHKALSDSIFTDRKEKQTRELLVQYETSKKEKDLQLKAQSIALLQKNADVQTLQLGKARANRNLALSIAGLLLVIMALILNQYRLNRRNTGLVRKKNDTLEGLVKDKDRLLEEKVWLLKEVHHRVKNNLQTVLSLLESQSCFVNKEALPAIEDSKNRVYAMSLIHKTLYQSEDVTAIHMDAYLKELVQHLRDSMPDDQRILFLLDIDPIELDVSQAVPVGLIVNEAVTNAVKYAFSDRQGRNEVHIAMKCAAGNAVMLTLADNGQGMAVAGKRSEGLGMRLMKGLTEDINGQFTVNSQQGVRIEVAFTANALLPNVSEVMA